MKNRWSYWLLLIGFTMLMILSLGGGVWGSEQSIGHWTGKLFENVCHQDPRRSFTIYNTPMAVNSRCFGIFFGLWIGWLALPFILWFTMRNVWKNWFLLVAVILQIIDYVGNHLLWENNNTSRAILGFLLGVATATYLSDFFQTKNKQSLS